VVLENQHIIRKADIAAVTEDMFIESEIISIDYQNGQGFIKDNKGIKDFYFAFSHCMYQPNLGDIVKFIPGINFHRDYLEMPMAYCISKALRKVNKAVIYRCINGPDYFNLFLNDSKIERSYFARVRSNEVSYIKNFNGNFEVDQVFEFHIIHSNETNGRLPRIKLLEFIN
jgi:hypothetical protein